MPRHRVKIIINPNANLGRARNSAMDILPIAEELGGADWVGTVYPMHAFELARQTADEGYEMVIAAGGDGTAHEVANGLMQIPPERRPKMGVLPLGSGNDFSHTIGIDSNPAAAMRQILTGKPERIDIGRFWDNLGRSEYFVNAIGIGFDATVTIRSRKVAFFSGFMIYFIAVLQTILFNHEAPQMSIKTDCESWMDETMMIVMCNGGREGGGFNVSPQAKSNDGILNYTAVQKVSRLKMLKLLSSCLSGDLQGCNQIRMGEFQRIEIDADRPVNIHADGEIIAVREMDVRKVGVEILQGELEVVR